MSINIPANIDNEPTQQSAVEQNKPEEDNSSSGNMTLDELDNPFKIAEQLRKFNVPGVESDKPQNDDQQKPTQQKVDDSQTKITKPEEKPEDKKPEEKELTEEEVNAIINGDPLLAKVEAYKSLGHTEEEAFKLVYGNQNDQAKPEDDFKLPEIDPRIVEEVETKYSKLQQGDYDFLNRIIQNQITDSDILFFLKSDPEMAKEIGIDNVTALTELPVIEDKLLNASFKRLIKGEIQKNYMPVINKISAYQNYCKELDTAMNNFNAKINAELLNEFPMMYGKSTNNPELQLKHDSIYKTWENMFTKEMNKFSQVEQNNPKTLKAIITKVNKQFKPVYNQLINKYAMNTDNMQNNPAIANQKMQDMANVMSHSGGTNVENAKGYIIKDMDNPTEVGNVLNELLNKKKE